MGYYAWRTPMAYFHWLFNTTIVACFLFSAPISAAITASDLTNIRNSAAGQCISSGLNNFISTVDCVFNDEAQLWAYDSATGALVNSQGMCIDALTPKSLTTLASCTNSTTQQWQYDSASKNYINGANGQCLDAWGGKTDTRIGVWDCVGKLRQEFESYNAPVLSDTTWADMGLHFNGRAVIVDSVGKRLFFKLGEGYDSIKPWTVSTVYDPASPYTLKAQGKTLLNQSTNTLFQVSYGTNIPVNRFKDGKLDDQYTLVFTSQKKWNILMISVDDLNAWTGHLGSHPNAITPNLDKMAAAGLSFRHAYGASPACNPSRTALFTGVRPGTSGVYGNQDEYLTALRTYETIPKYLSRHGYTTMSTGKLFHQKSANPEFFDTDYQATGSLTSPQRLNGLDTLPAKFDWGPIAIADDNTPDFIRANWAAQQLQGDLQEPFFMAVGIYRPHLPWYAPEDYFNLFPLNEVQLPPGVFAGDLTDIPAIGQMNNSDKHDKIVAGDQWYEGVQAYLASVAYADAAVGRIYDSINNSIYRDNTIIVLWGDHGWQLGEKERWSKFTLWAAGSRTSLIVIVPGLTPAGRIVDTPVDLMSIYPTLLELTDLPQNTQNEGVSIVPLLKDPDVNWQHPAVMTLNGQHDAVRYENWSFISHPGGEEQLYDHAVDPYEWNNLANLPGTEETRSMLRAMLP